MDSRKGAINAGLLRGVFWFGGDPRMRCQPAESKGRVKVVSEEAKRKRDRLEAALYAADCLFETRTANKQRN